MKKVGEHLNTISLVTALSAALVMALPAAAGAQFMDPVLDQYAPSNQQIDKKVKGDKGDNGGGGTEGDSQSGQAGAVAGSGQGADGDTNDGSGNGAGGAGGGSGGGGSGGSGGGVGGAASGGTAGTNSGAGDSGLDARLLADLPVTWFDFLAFALAAGALIATALLLRRLSCSPRVEG